MQFLLISQRAKANPQFHLKDLPGHGRFDVVVRCILAATRQIGQLQGSNIYCYLKGSTPWGWLAISPEFISEEDDEISLAASIQEHWNDVFTQGSLQDLIRQLPVPCYLLAEDGDQITSFDGTIILGAQRDLTEEDLQVISFDGKISLGKRSLLASHAIIYSRQLNI